ncbi:MAG: hypothetical protein KBT27_09415 [Prevotellaceae bacterium]|nr:hypothetical protein [Candidatus Faecinaster equi]
MDLLKIAINTSFMKGLVSKTLARVMHNKIGIGPEIDIHELSLKNTQDGLVEVRVDTTLTLTHDELEFLLSKIE